MEKKTNKKPIIQNDDTPIEKLPVSVFKALGSSQRKKYTRLRREGLSMEEALEKAKRPSGKPQPEQVPQEDIQFHPNCKMTADEVRDMASMLPNSVLRNRFRYLVTKKGLNPDSVMANILSEPEVKDMIEDLELTGCAPPMPEKFRRYLKSVGKQGPPAKQARRGPPKKAPVDPPGADQTFKKQCERLISNISNFGGSIPLAMPGLSDMGWNEEQDDRGHSEPGPSLEAIANLPGVEGPLKEQYERLLNNVSKIGGFSNVNFGGPFPDNDSGMPPPKAGPSRQKRRALDEEHLPPMKSRHYGEPGPRQPGIRERGFGESGPFPPEQYYDERPPVRPGEDRSNNRQVGPGMPAQRPDRHGPGHSRPWPGGNQQMNVGLLGDRPMDGPPSNRFNDAPQGHGSQGNIPPLHGPQGYDRPHGMPPFNQRPQGNTPFNNGPLYNPPFNNSPQGNMSFNSGPQGNIPFNNGPQGNMPFNNGPQGNMPPSNCGPQGNMQGNMMPFNSLPQNNMGLFNNGPPNVPPNNNEPQGNFPPFNNGPQGNLLPFNNGPHGHTAQSRGNMPQGDPHFGSSSRGMPPVASTGPPKRPQDSTPVDGDPKAPLYIVPMRYPSERFSEEQMDVIENSILDAILEIDDERLKPTFQDSFRNNGRYGVICNDQLSKNWLFNYLSRCQPWPYASFKIISAVPTKVRAEAVLPLCRNDDNDKILKFISKQNVRLNTSQWEVVQRVDGISNTTLSLEIDEESASVLRDSGMVNFKMGRAEIMVEGRKVEQRRSGEEGRSDPSGGGIRRNESHVVPDRSNPGRGAGPRRGEGPVLSERSGPGYGAGPQPKFDHQGSHRRPEMVQLATPPPPPSFDTAMKSLQRSPEYEPPKTRRDRYFRTPSPDLTLGRDQQTNVNQAPKAGGHVQRDKDRSIPVVDSRRTSDSNFRNRPPKRSTAADRSVQSQRISSINSGSSQSRH